MTKLVRVVKIFTLFRLIINGYDTSIVVFSGRYTRSVFLGGLIGVDNELLIVHICNFNLDKLRLLKLDLLYLSSNRVPRSEIIQNKISLNNYKFPFFSNLNYERAFTI